MIHGSRRPARSVVRSENAPATGLQITEVERAEPGDEGEDLLLVRRVDRLGLLGEQHLDRPEEPGPEPDARDGQEATQRTLGLAVGSASARGGAVGSDVIRARCH